MDGGSTWDQQKISASTSHYDVAAFSTTHGIATGREGAVARTADGITWTEVIKPSGSEKKVTYLQRNPNEGLGFMVMEVSRQKCDGFFLTDDFSKQESLYSTDGIAWNKLDAMTNSVAAKSGQLLIYKEKGFAYHYPGVETESDYSVTPVKNVSPHFAATSCNNVPRIKILDEIICPIGQGTGWISLGKDLKTGQPLVIYSGNRTFFVADVSPSTSGNPMIAISAVLGASDERGSVAGNGVIAIASDGSVYAASTQF